MAADEWLLDHGGVFDGPVFRSYGWTSPAATFGYSQRHAEVESWTLLRPLIRRCTGGGLVAHDADWTYSVIVPAGHPWWHLRASESYCRLHQWVQRAFLELGVASELAPVPDPSGPGRCFVGAEESDLLLNGRKIGGAAQRRSRTGLLIQGSVQPPPPTTTRTFWERAMQFVAERDGARLWRPWHPDALCLSEMEAIAVAKYRSQEYLRRR